MHIKEKDVKILWGLSAGRCNYPGCGEVCIKFIDGSDPTVVGEMAHVIAKNPGGPRSQLGDDQCNTYENLILLCPNHHTLIDRGPVDKFPAALLHDWKKGHEAMVSQACITPSFTEKKGLCRYVAGILRENKRLWRAFGPESERARNNPVNSAAMIWALRKLDTIIPNNRALVAILKRHASLLSPAEIAICDDFVTHAEAFELNASERQDSDAVPRFPIAFERMVLESARDD